MATWHYSVSLLPRQRVLELAGSRPTRLAQELVETTRWWSAQRAPLALEEGFAALLPERTDGLGDTRTWGGGDGDRVEIRYRSREVVSIVAHIALHEPAACFLPGLVQLARQADCVFLSEDLTVVEPTRAALIAALWESDACAFALDPRQFLQTVGNCTYAS